MSVSEASNASLQVEIDGRKAQEGSRVVTRSLDDIERRATRTVSAVDTLRTSFGSLALKVGAFIGVTMGFNTMIQNTLGAERALAKMQGIIKATGGVAGRTSEQLEAFSTALQKTTIYGDDAIQEGMALLLTFRNVRTEVFDRTTKAALDMATAIGMDLKGAIQMLGRAVNDPATGMTMLSRVGIKISEPLQKTIKDLVSMGKVVEAQNLVLSEMEKRFGGLATSMRGNLGGSIEAFKNAFGDLFEMNKLKGASSLAQEMEKLTATISSDKARKAADVIGGALFTAINAVAKATATLFSFIEEHSTAVKVAVYGVVGSFVALKGAVIAVSLAKMTGEFAVWISMFPSAVKGIKDFVAWLSLIGPGKTLLMGVTGAIETMAFTIQWVLIPALAALMAYDVFFKKDSYHVAPVGGPNSTQAMSGTRGEARQKLAEQQAQMDQLDMMRLAGLQSGGGTSPYDTGGKGKGAGAGSGPSAAEKLVAGIRDQMKYLNADGASFLPILDSWQKKLKPLSSDWKAVADLSLEIRQNMAQTAAQSVKSELDRIQKAKDEQEELQKIVAETGQTTLDFYKTLNGSGMMSDAEYLKIVEDRMEAIRKKYQEMVGEGVSIKTLLEGDGEYRDLFGEAQAQMVDTATKAMDTLKGQYDNGKISLGQYQEGLASLLEQYQQFPLAVEAIQTAIDGLNQAVESSKITLESLAKDAQEALTTKLAGVGDELADAFAGAIAYGNDLSGTLKKLGQDIAYLILKTLILKAIGGIFGGGGGGVAVGSPVPYGGMLKINHSGGIIGYEGSRRYVHDLARFHTGGLSQDEQVAVLKRGEGVFTPEQMRVLGQNQKQEAQQINVTIHAVDAPSFVSLLERNGNALDSIVTRSIRRGGSMQAAVRGAM